MNGRRQAVDRLPRIGTFVAAVLIGIGLGALVSADPVTIPLVGTVSGLAAGTTGLAVGGVLYAVTPGSCGCGCSGDCGC